MGDVTGLFRSTDAGEHWTLLTGGYVVTVAFDPNYANRIYAGSGKTLEKSEDGGITWQPISPGFTSRSISTVVLDPTDPATIYAGTWGGVFKSTDAGAHWAVSVSGMTNSSVHAIAVDPAAPDTVYAGTWGDGLFKSTDRGGTWDSANGTAGFITVLALLIDPFPSNTLFAGDRGLLKSTDGAATWTPTGISDLISVIAMDPTDPAILYASGSHLYRSTDGGRTWGPVGLASGGAYPLAIDPNSPSRFYTARDACLPDPADPSNSICGNNVFKSTDAGATWDRTALGNIGVSICLAVAATVPSTVYAGTAGNNGLFASTDGGDSWTRLPLNMLYNVISAVAVDRTVPTTMYAGGNGVWKSTDGGKTSHILTGGLLSPIQTLTIDPSNPNLIYAGTDGQGVLAFEEVLTPSPTATPTPTAAPVSCVGDCNDDGSVTVDEVLAMVAIALGSANTSACDAGDTNGDREITVDEILEAVSNALNGCGG